MIKYQLVRFDEDSKNFAGQWGIQSSEGGKLIGVSDFDGYRLTYPGGPNASWTAEFDCGQSESMDGYWDAVPAANDYAVVHGITL